uniref:Uncharacterized protein n=1 Tax=Panagrolaimus davidi TaxID=227884 RepID=A0A914PWU3_9BILA
MKKHPEIHFVLHFHGQFSEEEIKKFQTFVDKILESTRPLHQPPVISFPGQNGVKFGVLVKLSWSYL